MVGLGGQGRLLIEAIHGKSDEIMVVRGVTVVATEATTARDRYGIEVGSSFEEVLSDPRVDAVLIATPPSLHVTQACAAAAAGKHVMLEKPFALTIEGARRVAAACRDAGVVLAPGFNHRFLPAMMALGDLVHNGELGQLLYAEANNSSNMGARPIDSTNWRLSAAENPGNARGMISHGIHVLDALIGLLGPAVSAYATGQKIASTGNFYDVVSTHLSFKSGLAATLATVLGTPPLWRIQLFGTIASAEVRDFHHLVVKRADGQIRQTTFPGVSIERAELEAFATSIAEGTGYPIEAREAVEGVALYEAIVKSLDSGNIMEVEGAATI